MTFVFGLGAVLVLLGLGYVALVMAAWGRYGHARHPARGEVVSAPPEIVLAAASEMNMQQSPVVRAIFAIRAFVLRAAPDATPRPTGLLDQMRSLGWGDLAIAPGREVVMPAAAISGPKRGRSRPMTWRDGDFAGTGRDSLRAWL